ncbi:MAG TPA: hypothetical protein VD883_00885 [Candidatus Omnitrophota bacterium]|nr:hypothetical protein [Candidatus Omnitrophota bacterium]
MRSFPLILVLLALLCAPSCSEEITAGREFYGATVLLVDHDKGLLGVLAYDEITDREEKVSFRVDPSEVFVTDALNQPIDFSDVREGDQVDIFTETDKNGREIVKDIADRSRLERP